MGDDLADFPVTATFRFGDLAMLRSLLFTRTVAEDRVYDEITKILNEAYVRFCEQQKNYFRDSQPL